MKDSVRPNPKLGLVARVEDEDPTTLGYGSQAVTGQPIVTMPSASGDDPAVFEAIDNCCAEAGFEFPADILDLSQAIVECGRHTDRQMRWRIQYQGRKAYCAQFKKYVESSRSKAAHLTEKNDRCRMESDKVLLVLSEARRDLAAKPSGL